MYEIRVEYFQGLRFIAAPVFSFPCVSFGLNKICHRFFTFHLLHILLLSSVAKRQELPVQQSVLVCIQPSDTAHVEVCSRLYPTVRYCLLRSLFSTVSNHQILLM